MKSQSLNLFNFLSRYWYPCMSRREVFLLEHQITDADEVTMKMLSAKWRPFFQWEMSLI